MHSFISSFIPTEHGNLLDDRAEDSGRDSPHLLVHVFLRLRFHLPRLAGHDFRARRSLRPLHRLQDDHLRGIDGNILLLLLLLLFSFDLAFFVVRKVVVGV